MKVYVFGNKDLEEDSKAIKAAHELEEKIDSLEFVIVNPNEDVPFADEDKVVIMDVVDGIDEVKVFDREAIGKLVLPPRSTVHDFDLSFQLKYLKKLGRLEEIILVGLPMKGEIDYSSIQSILRKLVAQDIQGS